MEISYWFELPFPLRPSTNRALKSYLGTPASPGTYGADTNAFQDRVETTKSFADAFEQVSRGLYLLSQQRSIEVCTRRDLPRLKKEIDAGCKRLHTAGALVERYTAFESGPEDDVPEWLGLVVEGYGDNLDDAFDRWRALAEEKSVSFNGLVCTPYNPTGATAIMEAAPEGRDDTYYFSVVEKIFEIIKSNPTNTHYEGTPAFGIWKKFIHREIGFLYCDNTISQNSLFSNY